MPPKRKKPADANVTGSQKVRKIDVNVVLEKDPFGCLPVECCYMVLSFLPLIDLGRSEVVCRSWMRLVRSWMSLSGIRLHFPSAWDPQCGVDDALLPYVFKRFACQERALRIGEPTSARRFPDAHHFTVAGDFAAWAAEKDNTINWQRLTFGGRETMVLDLKDLGEREQRMWVEDMTVNSDGFLLVRLMLGPSIYVLWDPTLPRSYRDVVYSLVDQRIIWRKDSADTCHQDMARYIPLFIGKHRVYLACRSSNNGYELVAFEFRTGAVLYRTPIVASILDGDHGYLKRKGVLELIQFGGDELIIQFNSDRLLSHTFGSVNSFTIINGADGRMEKLSCTGFRGHRAVVNASSASFALVGSPQKTSPEHSMDVVNIQTFAQQPDKTFSRTAVHVVTMPAGTASTSGVVIHPFTFQAFSFPAGNPGLQALTLSQSQDTEAGNKVNAALQHRWPGITVDGHYNVVAARSLTLPPRKPNRSGSHRRPLALCVKWRFHLTLLDERLVFDDPGSNAKYLFCFRPQWWEDICQKISAPGT